MLNSVEKKFLLKKESALYSGVTDGFGGDELFRE